MAFVYNATKMTLENAEVINQIFNNKDAINNNSIALEHLFSNAPIIEISRGQYKSWTDDDSGLDNGFYKVTSLKWNK